MVEQGFLAALCLALTLGCTGCSGSSDGRGDTDAGAARGADLACRQSATCTLDGCGCDDSLCDRNFPGVRNHTLDCCEARTTRTCPDKGLVCLFGRLRFECTAAGEIRDDPGYCEGPPPPLPGDQCTDDTSCRFCMGSKSARGRCAKQLPWNGRDAAWPDGYCQWPCDPALSAPSGRNPQCADTSYAVCVETTPGVGTCLQACAVAGNCRDGYACMRVLPGMSSVCVPAGASECDPPGDPIPQMRSCPMGKTCESLSPDASFGRCS